mgnify:FL=1
MKQKQISTYKRIFKEDENESSNYVIKLLEIADQIKIFHLQTTGYASHIALGGFYYQISTFTDSFCEKRIGLENKRPTVNGQSISLKDFKEEELISYVNETLNYFKSLRKEVSGNTDLENLVDEIIGSSNQLKYLLTLK